MARTRLQRTRAWFQIGFFTLFVLAPPLDIFRVDLTRGHAILLGRDWTLGIDAFLSGNTGVGDAAVNLFLRGFLPIVGGAALFLWLAWRYGRLYCGWLCPHFSVVELINGLMRRASGKPSLWERRRLPEREPDGRRLAPNPWYWLPTLIAVVGFAFLWALVFLTYLLPPFEVYHNLFTGRLTANQTLFLTVGTAALTVEFLLARHLFCNYACAVGLFQSLAWMANDRAVVVGFDTRRADACRACSDACNHACPMRLKPRTQKRKMFTCTQCGECIGACSQVQAGVGAGQPPRFGPSSSRASLLRWVAGSDALAVVTGRPDPSPEAGPTLGTQAEPEPKSGTPETRGPESRSSAAPRTARKATGPRPATG